uniref:F-box domain-containing protein n=1 Tax=Kalanchoe fedtschenkoi TaxID=63787 RepID=A0A7N0UE55_KALFE
MAQLPDHITDLILLNLPVKTLLRFRSVCRRWNDTVTSSTFAKQHMKSVAATPAACCNFFYSKASSCNQFCPRLSVFRISSAGPVRATGRVLHLPFRVDAAGVRKTWIHHSSCDGLLFMVELGVDVRSSFIRVWNPATGEHKDAAWPRSLTDMDANVMDGWVGFGHAPRVDDHKIVVMCDSGHGWSIQILSLKTNAWRAVAASPCLDSVRGGMDQQMNSVAVDGSVYWIVSVKTTEDGIYCEHGLLKFDLDEETFQVSFIIFYLQLKLFEIL